MKTMRPFSARRVTLPATVPSGRSVDQERFVASASRVSSSGGVVELEPLSAFQVRHTKIAILEEEVAELCVRRQRRRYPDMRSGGEQVAHVQDVELRTNEQRALRIGELAPDFHVACEAAVALQPEAVVAGGVLEAVNHVGVGLQVDVDAGCAQDDARARQRSAGRPSESEMALRSLQRAAARERTVAHRTGAGSDANSRYANRRTAPTARGRAAIITTRTGPLSRPARANHTKAQQLRAATSSGTNSSGARSKVTGATRASRKRFGRSQVTAAHVRRSTTAATPTTVASIRRMAATRATRDGTARQHREREIDLHQVPRRDAEEVQNRNVVGEAVEIERQEPAERERKADERRCTPRKASPIALEDGAEAARMSGAIPT